ncbi:MAG: hypothetical protein RIB65_11115 [Ilumatobacter fluminis]
MDMAHGTREERLSAAHATLQDGVAALVSGDDWRNLLQVAGSFHRYSPNNQMLLAVQGADGLVASFHAWKQIRAQDGQPCRIRKGETALRVYAPIRARNREIDPETGLQRDPAIVGFKLVPVFCQSQLVSPPDLPTQPKLLDGQDPPSELWDAVAAQISAAGFSLQRGPIECAPEAKGITKFVDRVVIVRDDLSTQQALKTQIHELAHVLMHDPSLGENGGMLRERVEVEAESVAFVVCNALGVDSADYSIPYVASWAGGDAERLLETAQTVLATGRKIIVGIEAELGVDLRPNPIADAISTSQVGEEQPSRPVRRATPGTADVVIFEHLVAGDVDWIRLAASLPGCDHDERTVRSVIDKPDGQAIVLAESGASAAATVAVLRAEHVDDRAIRGHLTANVTDTLGAVGPLYHPEEVQQALVAPRRAKEVADELVADLLVSAGRHPAGAMHLATTSNQPSNVINLVEERLRRRGHLAPAGTDTRADRGLTLIDEWTGRKPDSPTTPPVTPRAPEPPLPPEPAA